MFHPAIDGQLQAFIEEQKMFFTAATATSIRVNVSPKDTGMFRVLGSNIVAYMGLTGSDDETAAHVSENGRLTIMR
ncbi:hypothetical protein WI61_38645 [Burkholderia cepacia]|uniref:hypothetical protein n=1 Tax=Burkholderia cepacia TaxID=292 RepID=UPI000759CC91|nr:hypothetical protein [Burkholderia cepacia]KVA64605.1 hypothetical protein WI49_17405 [Burkholderia cepacia]KVB02844.1 hypothetical protein WI55_01295 [Burkholderia cepacia]KVB32288.1 hypothetical protein WI57_10825 [Burkholderia cepacia]KVB48870.1 hypothetical protein WI60_25865 [Burkholderia cepacia]KVB61088.1 hypothetical protein WI59_35350 [Burkholderia cepacia]